MSGQRYCATCGHSSDVGAFCPRCGQPLTSRASTPSRLPFLLVGVAALLAVGMVAAALTLTKSGPDTTRTVTEHRVAAVAPPAKPKRHRTQRATPTTAPATPQPAPPSLVPYSATYFTMDRPDGWTAEHEDVDQGGFLRSQWRDPADPNTSVLVDAQEEDLTAQEKLAQVRASTTGPGFADLGSTDTTVNGVPAIKWEFEVSGDHRVDYFVHDDSCGVGVAMLGSTSPGEWTSRRATFSKIADSVAIDCSAAGSSDGADTSAGDACDPNYEGACLDPTSSDYDCQDGSGDGPDYTGPVTVVGDDHFGLDRDGNGEACNW